MTDTRHADAWPALSYANDHATFATLHLWTQVVGKVRLALTPWTNHSWHVPLYLSARGLTTSLVPHPHGPFDLEFDFLAERLVLRSARGGTDSIALAPGAVARFHADVLAMLEAAGVPTAIDGTPNELADAIPFAQDSAPRAYDPDAAVRLWRALLASDSVLKRFRTAFLGKVSPVHFFWGSFDLAVTRFSGRRAPLHPGGVPHLPDAVVREAYSHEVSSAGFWPGGPGMPYAVFYSYAYPEPPEFREARGLPAAAHYETGLGEYVVPYEYVRSAPDPEAALMDFLQASYAAAAGLGGWDREALECDMGVPRVVRKI